MSDKIQEIRAELEQYQADMVSLSKLRLLGLAGDLLLIVEKQAIEIRALQPDEQMSLLRVAQRDLNELSESIRKALAPLELNQERIDSAVQVVVARLVNAESDYRLCRLQVDELQKRLAESEAKLHGMEQWEPMIQTLRDERDDLKAKLAAYEKPFGEVEVNEAPKPVAKPCATCAMPGIRHQPGCIYDPTQKENQ